MNFSLSPRKDIVDDSSKIQQNLLNRFLNTAPDAFKTRNNFFDSLKQGNTDTMKRRLDSRRHPMTGMSGMRDRNQSFQHSEIVQEAIKKSHKLNPRILETWLNNTVADAEEFELPSSVLKHENKQPLARFGIDRSSLLNSGLPSLEVDRLYQSLFVHSIGFYQLILKVLEHTEKKYTIVTGIWKVFAILLEYCCQLDYQMIITTLNLEKREELEQLENDYKGQISLMEENEKRLMDSISSVKNQLKAIQKDLQKEIEKREELEDELMQRGSGHEEEVAMRLSFESKLNQMYAKQRDLTTKIEQLSEIVAEQQKMMEMKTEQVAKEKKRANDLIQGKIEAEQEMKKMEEKQKQLEVINNNLENRLDDALVKIDQINVNLSKCQLELSESMNENAQKRIFIDDQRFEIDVCKVQIGKLEALIDEYLIEKEMFNRRISELEQTYTNEYEKNKHFEQEYQVIKESEAVASQELIKFKARSEELTAENGKLERERDKLKVDLDSAEMLVEELKFQVKKSQERMEEMNRGRRIVEELNENLKQKLDEKIADLIEARRIITDLKTEIDNLRTRENELVGEVGSLCIKIKSLEKQFETTKETMQEKINNLNDILTSEKKIRENWIYRYEEEQRMHQQTNKELIETEDKLNESIMKLNSASASLDEKSSALDKYVKKNKEQFEEILNLRSVEEDFSRKNKTLNILIANIEKDYKGKILEIGVEIDEMKQDHLRNIERKNIEYEDLWHLAQMSYEELLEKYEEIKNLNKIIENKDSEICDGLAVIAEKNRSIEGRSMVIAEFEQFAIRQAGIIVEKEQEKEKIRIELFELNKTHQSFLNNIPRHLRKEKNPFLILEDRIKELESELKKIQALKESMQDEETQFQFEPSVDDRIIQTEIDMAEFEKMTKRPVSKPSEKIEKIEKADKYVQCTMPENVRSSIGTSHGESSHNELSIKKRISTEEALKPDSKKNLRQQSAESMQREEEVVTPVNLKSIYKHEEKSEDRSDNRIEETKTADMKLPMIGKKQIPVRPPTMSSILMSSEIKRHIKQANSRRKHESMF